MPSRAIIEIAIKDDGGKEVLTNLRQQLEALGVSVVKVRDEATQQEAAFNRLWSRIDPASKATADLAKNHQALAFGLQQGKISADQYATGLVAVETQYYKTATAGQGMLGQLMNMKTLIAGAAVGAGIGKGLGWLSDTTAMAAEAEAAQMKLEAMVRATGGAAGYTAAQLDTMATSLSRVTGIEDENVKQAEAVLLTYKNIPHEAFEPTLKAASDLAALMGTDLVDAARMLGTVFDNPVAGMGRLTKAGLGLSESLKAQVKDLYEHGHTVEAVDLLLASFQGRMGGLGEEMGGSFANQLKKVGNEWKNVREEMGLFWVSAEGGKGTLNDLATVLGMVADQLKEIREAGSGAAGAGATAGGILGTLLVGPAGAGALTNIGQLLEVLRLIAATKDKGYSTTVPERGFVTDPNAGRYTVDAAGAWKVYTDALHKAVEEMDKFLVREKKFEDARFDVTISKATLGLDNFANTISDTLGQAGNQAADQFAATFGQGLSLKSDRTFSAFATYAGKNFGMTMGQEIPGGIVSAGGGVAEVMSGMGDRAAQHFGDAFRDGFMAVLTGKDMADAWGALWSGLAGMAAQSMGNMFTALFQGKSMSEVGQAGGLWTPGKDGKPGTFNWGAALGMGGGLISSYGVQSANRGMAALGGATAGVGTAMALGATTGSTLGIIGLIVGAVVGGVIGYFSNSGAKSYNYEVYAGSTGSAVKTGYGGPDAATTADMAKQLNDKLQSTNMAFRDLLKQMGQANVMPVLGFNWSGSTTDFGAVFKTMLEASLPKAIFQAFKPLLGAGMAGLGISEGRVAQQLGAFDTSQFATAMAALKDYIAAVIRLRDLHTELSKSLTTLKTELTQGIRQTWRAGVDETLATLKDLATGLDQLTSQEQVTRAGQIADLAEQQYKTNLEYLRQIFQVQQQVKDSFAATFLGFEEQKAGEAGPGQLQKFYYDQLIGLQKQLEAFRLMPGTGSAEDIARITQLMQAYAQKLFNVVNPGEGFMGGPTMRDWVEQFLKDQQRMANDLLEFYAQQVRDTNAALLQSIEAVTGALQNETTVRAEVTDVLEEEAGRIRDVTGALQQFQSALDQATGVLLAFGSAGADSGLQSYGRVA